LKSGPTGNRLLSLSDLAEPLYRFSVFKPLQDCWLPVTPRVPCTTSWPGEKKSNIEERWREWEEGSEIWEIFALLALQDERPCQTRGFCLCLQLRRGRAI